MKKILGAVALASVPAVALAQSQVPPIELAQAQPGSLAQSGPYDPPRGQGGGGAAGGPAAVPPGMPPAVQLVSPSAPLNARERQAVGLARRWSNRNQPATPGEDGVVRYLFGSTLPVIVCAPLRTCNLALQPGEIVNNVNVGDLPRWKITPAISGEGNERVTHLIIKPTDAGLTSSLDITTNRRTYVLRLVSTQRDYMPMTAFNYPDDAQRQWAAYQQQAAFGAASSTLSTGQRVENLDFAFSISGDNPSWRPIRVYTDGAHTYIQFPPSMSSGSAPALVGLGNDGGWFSQPSTQMVNYRLAGDRFIVDRVLERAALISGVGSDQVRVTITRERAR